MKKVILSMILSLGLFNFGTLSAQEDYSAIMHYEALKNVERIISDQIFSIPEMNLQLRWDETIKSLYIYRARHTDEVQICLDGMATRKQTVEWSFEELYTLEDSAIMTRLFYDEQGRGYRIYLDDDVMVWRLRVIENSEPRKIVFRTNWPKERCE